MKNHFFRFMAVTFVAAVATAQLPGQDLESLGKQAQGMGGLGNLSGIAQKLHLSPQQMSLVMPILEAELPELQAIKGNPTLSNKQKQTQAKAVQQQSDSKLKTILSPQQFGSFARVPHGATAGTDARSIATLKNQPFEPRLARSLQ